MQERISTEDWLGNLMIAVGSVADCHTSSGSSTVMLPEATAVTKVNGPEIDAPMKSPTTTTEVGLAEVVITPVDVLNAVALIPVLLAIAPTH
jgi:hypothetical protein